MATFTKFSEWLDTELLPLPSQQTISTDQLVVIRAGVPYAYDPLTRFAYADMKGNAAATTINTVDVWEPIGGVLVASGVETGFTLATNIFTTTAETSVGVLSIQAGCTVMKVGGGTAVNFELGIFVNGVMAGAGQSGLASAAQWGNMNVFVPVILANGDTVEIKIRNRTDSDDVVVSEMAFEIE
jgi:hypothetical protein